MQDDTVHGYEGPQDVTKVTGKLKRECQVLESRSHELITRLALHRSPADLLSIQSELLTLTDAVADVREEMAELT